MNNDLIDVKTLKPFTRFIYTIGELPTSYLISMTYEEQLIWLCNYLEKTVIPTINNNGEAVSELQTKFLELKSYVDQYFDNLDVQEEINNKLDEMAQSGELTDIIAQYLELAGILSYNTINDLKNATNIVDGSICRTLGYYEINDNGGALYKIRNILNTDVINDGNIVSLSDNNLVAELIYQGYVNVKCFGVKGDGITNDTTNLQNAITYSNNKKLILNNEIYLINETINLSNNILIGNKSTIKASSSFNANYMLNLSNDNILKNIVFDNNNYSYSTNNELATDNKLVIENCEFIHTKINVDSNNFALNNALNLTAKETIVKDCKIYDNLSHGLRLISTQSNSVATIDNCKIYNNGNYNSTLITACGLVEYTRTIGNNYDKVLITNCEAYNNANTGIAVHSLNNCIITNCYSHNNNEHGIALMDGQNCIVEKCILTNNNAYGVRVQGDYTSENYGYNDFIINNNLFIGNSGLHISNNVKNGIITNNILIANISGTTRFGIVLGDDNLLNDTIEYLTIKNNKFSGVSYSNTTKIFPYFVLNETNEIDTIYYVNGNEFNSYITPKELYSNVYNNLNTNYSSFSDWSIPGSITDNTITPSGNLIARKNISISGKPHFINIMMKKDDYNDNISIGLRFRDTNNTLINITRIKDSYTTNSITARTKMNANFISKIFDLSKYSFSNTPAYYEIFLESSSNTPITINSIYTSCSNDNTVINS